MSETDVESINTPFSDRDNRDNRESPLLQALAIPEESFAAGIAGILDAETTPPAQVTPEKPETGFTIQLGKKGVRSGVYFTGDDGKARWICSPLNVLALTRDEANGNWGRLLSFKDRDRTAHKWAMPMAMLKTDGAELRGELLRQGLEIATGLSERKLLIDYIQQARTQNTARAVDKTGWHGKAFVLPDRTLGDQSAEQVFFQTTSLDGLTLAQKGTLESWRETVCQPCAGNSRLVLAICTAFAALCVGIVDSEGGGVHLKGKSSSGKSTAQRVAVSVFSAPRYKRSWRTTDNGLESICFAHNHMLLVLDEIGELDPKHAAATAYMLANGAGKSRANRDGNAKGIKTWALLFLSSGEKGLSDLVLESGKTAMAGQEVRICDIAADAGQGFGVFDALPAGVSGAEFSDQLKSAAEANYGHAAPAFIEHAAQEFDSLRTQLREAQSEFCTAFVPSKASGQVSRVAARFGLIAQAGEVATAWGLTGWQPGEATKAAKRCFEEWLGARASVGDSETPAMLAQVRGFLELHGESRFTPWDGADHDRPTINRAGFCKTSSDCKTFYVLRETFQKEVCKGMDAKAVAKALRDAGALKPDSDGTATRNESLPGMPKQRCYVILPKIWEA